MTTKITDLFQEYTKTLIEYIQDKKRQERQENHSYGDQEEDILFSNMDETIHEEQRESTKSFWGKEKIIRKSTRMFSNNNRKF
jgi:hypothetical protein